MQVSNNCITFASEIKEQFRDKQLKGKNNMNEDLVITTRIATQICNILNEKREKVFEDISNLDEFGFAVGKTYIKIGFKHKKDEKLFSADGFIDIHNKVYYPSAGWSKPNKRYPKEITPSNIETIAMMIYPYAFYPFVTEK